MRQIIISAIGLVVIAIGFFGMKSLGSNERPEPEKTKKSIPSVFIETVTNSSTAIKVTASGNLQAKNRLELFSEVQGVFEYSAQLFKPGTYYKSGTTLLSLNSDEQKASIKSQKSTLFNQLATLLPDLKFDYPEAYDKWKSYVDAFDMDKAIADLPNYDSDREKLFIASRNVTSTWFTIKNMEERLRKYTIYAPFSGVLVEANVDKGTLVRAGQKLGEFINPNLYELEVALNSNYLNLLKRGNTVNLKNVDGTQTWNGKVSRINSMIDPNTQTVQVYISVSGKGLREGMYLEAELTAKNEDNTYVISRKLIQDSDQLFILKNDTLRLLEIKPIHFNEKTVVVRGLQNGDKILSKSLPGAYDGMQVKAFSDDK